MRVYLPATLPGLADLLRKLESLQQEMGFNERPVLDKVKARVQEVHDDLLLGLMEGKHK